MPATAKRGFRLPWMRDDSGSESAAAQLLEGQPTDAPAPNAASTTEPEAEALDDLGSGPFGIAPSPREIPRRTDPGEALDLDQRTAPEPDRDGTTDGATGGDVPKWLRQGPVDAFAEALPAEADRADTRPGINVVSGVDVALSSSPPIHESAPASAWPEADFAARTATAPSPAQREPGTDGEPAPPPPDRPAVAPAVATPGLVETPRLDLDAPRPAGEPIAGDAAALPEPAEPASSPDPSDASTPAEPGATGGPTPGRRAGSQRVATPAPAVQPVHERRDNPLLTGLVRAMRDSARNTREETTARLRVEAEARVVAIRARSAADAVALRTQADDDVAGIREWSKAEMARIRLETAERIEARRSQLATDSHALSSLTSRLVSEIEAAVASFEAEMKRFFKALLAEEDPAQLATLAERMPVPPKLEALPEAVAVGIDHVSSGAKGRANRVAAKPARGAKGAARSSAPKSGTGARSSEARSNRRPPSGVPPSGARVPLAGDTTGRPATLDAGALDPEAAALAEAEALAGLDLSAVAGGDWPLVSVTPSSNGTAPHEPMEGGAQAGPAEDELMIESQTRLIVVGLGDAGVAAFEGALRGVSGVGSVNVGPGGDGEVVFSVTHGAATDLRAAVPGLPGFRAHVTADEGAILSVAAHDPH